MNHRPELPTISLLHCGRLGASALLAVLAIAAVGVGFYFPFGRSRTLTLPGIVDEMMDRMLGPDFDLAAFKGVPLTFRSWDRQLRQPILLAQPTALVVANAVFRACETIGYPECAINLAHGVAYLASAKKSHGPISA